MTHPIRNLNLWVPSQVDRDVVGRSLFEVSKWWLIAIPDGDYYLSARGNIYVYHEIMCWIRAVRDIIDWSKE